MQYMARPMVCAGRYSPLQYLPEGDTELCRVLRGGSWNNKPQNVRSANRNRNAPANRNNNVGFRLASPPACCQDIPEQCESSVAHGFRSVPAGVHGIAFRLVRMTQPNSLRRVAAKRGK
ncbi:MAG: SUMF1/EgtB/PvdO family nonheme iron enzyme [Candidatus Thiodiazotropha sp. (ex. Lucinisca nassula)]|nr:SUMF1/EgtB/PvdO family nonheme iron enzyme [Candidatus Thiodiazotropha sp. (ex. Lucinisca nassula)]MBW9273057.1 SUMF1/EgtB/PvdO family nonheme iron enzyme [Candidatus Thiodiazotropha sp. (ex. Lucinisca nassula)]